MRLFRTKNLLNLEQLERLTIAFCGEGSLGSLVTSLLAYPWAKIILIDPETLEENNVERHLLGYSQVGRYKVDGIEDWLIDRGIDPKRIVTVTDVSKSREVLSSASIIVVSIDDPKPCYEINQLAIELNIPAVYGGVYPMGTGGQTVVVPTPKEACYVCSQIKMGAIEYKGKDPAGDYGVNPLELKNNTGKLTAVPSLKYSIAAVASDMALAVMEILAGTAEPEILIHAQTWEGIINLRPGKILTSVISFIDFMCAVALSETMQVVLVDGKYVLRIRKGKLSHSLKRQSICTAHGSSVSADDI